MPTGLEKRIVLIAANHGFDQITAYNLDVVVAALEQEAQALAAS